MVVFCEKCGFFRGFQAGVSPAELRRWWSQGRGRPSGGWSAQGYVEGRGSLLGGQAGEIAKLDDLGGDRLLGGELIEGLVECQQIAGRVVVAESDLVEVDTLEPAAMASSTLMPGLLDEDAPIASAAAAKKWPRFSQAGPSPSPTSRRKASWTSAVAWRVCPVGSRASLASASFRSSS